MNKIGKVTTEKYPYNSANNNGYMEYCDISSGPL